jgi:thymidylate synthase (FAD)
MFEISEVKQLNSELFNPAFNEIYGMGVQVLNATEKPNTAVYLGMHQCYSDAPVNHPKKLTEEGLGSIIVDKLLGGDRGHFSPFEMATITFGLQYIPHSVLQQLLRSRIGVSPSVQSFRYTCDHILRAAKGDVKDVEKVVYLRPCGAYHDREKAYTYTDKERGEDLSLAHFCIKHVAKRLSEGMPPEQARGLLPFDYRQHAVVSFNARSLMGFFDRRTKKDAQEEIRVLADLMYQKFKIWMPEVADWYTKTRYQKAKLAP